jgi:hypothetical protein
MESPAKHHHEIKVFIDRKEHTSPDPTTGAALYALGRVNPQYDLYQEEPGPIDDKLVPNDATELRLKEYTHFYSAQRELNPGGEE